jgi:phage terminase large subunit GpA-like protein
MDAVADPRILEIWVMKSAQIGWTEMLNNVIGFYIDQDPSPILLVQPTIDVAEAWSKDRLAPMVRDTPCLRDKITDSRARDGNTLLHKKFRGGHLTIAGANSPSGLRSRPIRIALFDEVDGFPASAGAEGDPFSLGKKRTTTFWNRKILAGSTPTIKGSSRIEAGFDESDQRYYFVPCNHCREFQRLIWPQVKWDPAEPAKAWYACQHCGAVLTDADKQVMLRVGEWRATKPSKGIAGFHISEIYSPWVTWGEMAVAFLTAKKFPETLQTWINTALGETWEDKGETLEPKGLAARMEAYTADRLPPGILLLTCGTDVQDDRLETTVWGWGADEECWRVEHIVLRGNPGSQALWLEHDAILRRRWKTDDGRQLLIEAAAVDSGGHFTDHVYRYCSERKRFRVFAIKGQGGPGRLVWPKKASRSSKSRVSLWMIGVDTAKELLYGRLKKVTEQGPGYVHFDADTTNEFLEQMTSETVVFRQVQGRKVRLWKPKKTGIRQEALDCFVYAYAAMIGRGGPRVLAGRHSKPVQTVQAEEVGPNDATQDEEQEQPTPAPVKRIVQRIRPARRGWAKSW